jgi:hypothetical protein
VGAPPGSRHLSSVFLWAVRRWVVPSDNSMSACKTTTSPTCPGCPARAVAVHSLGTHAAGNGQVPHGPIPASAHPPPWPGFFQQGQHTSEVHGTRKKPKGISIGIVKINRCFRAVPLELRVTPELSTAVVNSGYPRLEIGSSRGGHGYEEPFQKTPRRCRCFRFHCRRSASTKAQEPLTLEQLAELQAAWAELTQAAEGSGVERFHASAHVPDSSGGKTLRRCRAWPRRCVASGQRPQW